MIGLNPFNANALFCLFRFPRLSLRGLRRDQLRIARGSHDASQQAPGLAIQSQVKDGTIGLSNRTEFLKLTCARSGHHLVTVQNIWPNSGVQSFKSQLCSRRTLPSQPLCSVSRIYLYPKDFSAKSEGLFRNYAEHPNGRYVSPAGGVVVASMI